MTKLVAGSLVVLVGVAAWMARRRNLAIRKPTEPERTSISEPVARILVRHFPMAGLSTDWADALTTVGATMAYVDNGPLLWPLTPAPVMPTMEGMPDVP